MSRSQYVLTMNSYGQITIPAPIRKKWRLDSTIVIMSKINEKGHMEIFPAAVVPKGYTLEGRPEWQNDLKNIYEKEYLGSDFSVDKLEAETKKK